MQASATSSVSTHPCFNNSPWKAVPQDMTQVIFKLLISCEKTANDSLERYKTLSLTCKPWKELLAQNTTVTTDLTLQLLSSGCRVNNAYLMRLSQICQPTAWTNLFNNHLNVCKDDSLELCWTHSEEEIKNTASKKASDFLAWLTTLPSQVREYINTLDLTDIAFTPEMRLSVIHLLPKLSSLTLNDTNLDASYWIKKDECLLLIKALPQLQLLVVNTTQIKVTSLNPNTLSFTLTFACRNTST